LMTEHLLKLGHRRIAFVAGPDHVLTSGDREAGYREAMDKAGQHPLVERSDFTIESGAAATAAFLDSRHDFTALFLSSDTIAIGAMAELRRRNVRVPDDLSVAGFGGEPAWVHGDPGLTTVETRLEEIGAAGVRRAIAELAGHAPDPRVHVHAVTILERGSTRPVRETARR
jgi:LacI family transcriptional regulator